MWDLNGWFWISMVLFILLIVIGWYARRITKAFLIMYKGIDDIMDILKTDRYENIIGEN